MIQLTTRQRIFVVKDLPYITPNVTAVQYTFRIASDFKIEIKFHESSTCPSTRV